MESNKTETASQNTTSSSVGQPITSGTPIVFPSDGVTESSLVNETVTNGNGTSTNDTTVDSMTTKAPSTSGMPTLEGIDYRQGMYFWLILVSGTKHIYFDFLTNLKTFAYLLVKIARRSLRL